MFFTLMFWYITRDMKSFRCYLFDVGLYGIYLVKSCRFNGKKKSVFV